MVACKLSCLLPAIFALALPGCERQSWGNAMSGKDDDRPVASGASTDFTDVPMGEAHTVISDEDLKNLKEKAEKGDREALRFLVLNYYGVNYGELHRETIYWEVKAARFGDCKLWEDLMFAVVEDGLQIPQEFFQPEETLQSIGKANGCSPYVPIKVRENPGARLR